MSLVAHLLTVTNAPTSGALAAAGRFSGQNDIKVN